LTLERYDDADVMSLRANPDFGVLLAGSVHRGRELAAA
jgi:hypothetical protein